MNRDAIIQELEIRDEIFKRKARQQLFYFTLYTFPDFEVNWHHKLVCSEIDDWINSSEPYNLMVFMPPRHSKSELCSRHLPPFVLGKNPNAQVIFSSYGADLAEDMSRDAQRIMLTDEYYDLFPRTKLKTRGGSRDETAIKQAGEFSIVNFKGSYRAAGVGGGITGRGADFAIIDDPVKTRKDAESKTIREGTKDWYRSTLRTRLEKNGRILLLMTRWHVDDLAGWLIKQMKIEPHADKWRIISLPAVYEADEYTHPEDKRKTGEPLWSDKYNKKALDKVRATIGSYEWNALFMQRPSTPGGAVCKREWLQVIDKAPEFLTWVRYWDLAVSKKTSADFTASGQMAIDRNGNVYVRKFVHEQLEWPVVKRMIMTISKQENVSVGIEAQGTQKGFLQDFIAEPKMRSVDLRGYDVDTDKLTRALPWIARAEAGKFFIVRGKGVDEYIEELVEFTGQDDAHDDQVDWTSGAYKMLAEYVEPEIYVAGEYYA